MVHYTKADWLPELLNTLLRAYHTALIDWHITRMTYFQTNKLLDEKDYLIDTILDWQTYRLKYYLTDILQEWQTTWMTTGTRHKIPILPVQYITYQQRLTLFLQNSKIVSALILWYDAFCSK